MPENRLAGSRPIRLPPEAVLIQVLLAVFAILVRLLLFPKVSNDYTNFLSPWFEKIKELGGLAAIGQPIGDYLVSYIYILAALTYLPISSLYSIKLVSCIGDLILAHYVCRIARVEDRRVSVSLIAYAAVLFLPTVVLNSAAWGQCDGLYTSAMVACVCYLLEGRGSASMAAYAVAFVLKLQAIFLAPFLLLCLLQRRIRLRELLWIPAIYLIVIMPSALAGRGVWNLLTVYFRQTQTYSELCLNAPNPYAWLPDNASQLWGKLGILLCGGLVLAGIAYLWLRGKKCGNRFLLLAAFLSLLFVPYLLPHMHERYYYPADVFAVVLALFFKKYRWLAPVSVGCSLLVVCRYLYGWWWVKPGWVAIPLAYVLLNAIADTFRCASGKRLPDGILI